MLVTNTNPMTTFDWKYWNILAQSNFEKAEQYRLSFEKKEIKEEIKEEIQEEIIEQTEEVKEEEILQDKQFEEDLILVQEKWLKKPFAVVWKNKKR